MDTFWYSPFSVSLAAHVVLHETGHPHRAVAVPLAPEGAGDDGFARINPQRTVPVLETGDGAIAQSLGILLHLGATYPGSELLPPSKGARAHEIARLSFLATDVHPLFRVLFRPDRFASEPARGDVTTRAAAAIEDRLQRFAEAHPAGPYLDGERFGLADTYLLVFATWLRHLGHDVPRRIGEIAKNVASRPASRRVLEIERSAREAVISRTPDC